MPATGGKISWPRSGSAECVSSDGSTVIEEAARLKDHTQLQSGALFMPAHFGVRQDG
jgi:hypothetical protein